MKHVFTIITVLLYLLHLTNGCLPKRCKNRDKTKPVVDCPKLGEIYSEKRQLFAIVDWDEPVPVRDNKDKGLRSTRRGLPPGSTFRKGNKVKYYAKDKAGNEGSCTVEFEIKVVYCNSPPTIQHGFMQQTPRKDNRYGSKVYYGCYKGYELRNPRSNVMECGKDGSWSGERPVCENVQCSDSLLYDTNYKCTGNYYKDECTYHCGQGYKVVGSKVRVCGYRGYWLGIRPRCVDIEPPIIECPPNRIIYTDEGEDTATFALKSPNVNDNSENVIVFELKGEKRRQYNVGRHDFVFSAKDWAGNKAKDCKFALIVKRLTCPVIYPTPSQEVTCPQGAGYGETCSFQCLHWTNLENPDGSTVSSKAKCDKHQNTNVARWNWNEQPICRAVPCPELSPPENGALVCDNWLYGRFCQVFCEEGMTIDQNYYKSLLSCYDGGMWQNMPDFNLPECRVLSKNIPQKYRKPMKVFYTYSGDCCDAEVRSEIQAKFLNIFKQSLYKSACQASCNIQHVTVSCASESCTDRKKRSTSDDSPLLVQAELTFTPDENGQLLNIEDISSLMDATVQALSNNSLINETLGLNLGEAKTFKMSYDCEEGLWPATTGIGCVGCATGFYFKKETQNCTQCPLGMYNDGSERFACTPCPGGYTTALSGSKLLSDCIDSCPPGKYSPQGTVPCSPCPEGMFTEHSGSTQCTKCPPGTTTATEMSSSSSDCQEFTFLVIPGMNGSYGLVNISLSEATWTLAFKCFVPDTNTTLPILEIRNMDEPLLTVNVQKDMGLSLNGQLVLNSSDELKPENWNSFVIELSLAQTAAMIPYINGRQHNAVNINPTYSTQSLTLVIGSQEDVNVSYEITDVNIWSGPVNDEIQNSSNKCLGNVFGDLLSWGSISKTMLFIDGAIFLPSACDVVDACAESPCQYGRCIDGVDTFTCVCEEGFSGDLCEIDTDDCESNACEDGSTCIDGVNNYTCQCPHDFKGYYCQLQLVNGGWSQWGEWSDCSKSCDGGVQTRQRTCSEPMPEEDGLPCSGSDGESRTCSLDACQVCPELYPPLNGYIICNYDNDSDLHSCTKHCNDGYDFSIENQDEYSCGYITSYEWNNATDLKCTEIKAPSDVSAQFAISYNTACNDENIEAINKLVEANLDEMLCLKSGACEVKAISISGDGCPIDKPGASGIEVAFVLTLVGVDENTVNVEGSDFVSQLEKPALELEADALRLYTYMEQNFTLVTSAGVVPVASSSAEPLIHCQSAGYTWVHYYCLACQAGSFEVNAWCDECPKGTYQDEEAQGQCKACPAGLTTSTIGSSTLDDCSVPPEEDAVCSSFSIEDLYISTGWLCGEIELVVHIQYLTQENFTNVIASIEITNDENRIVHTCPIKEENCVVNIPEKNLKQLSQYFVKGSVPNSDVTCSKTVTITYAGLSRKGKVLVGCVVSGVILLLSAIPVGLFIRSRKKVLPKDKKTPERATKYKI